MKAKLGPAAATTATAHKIAVIFYTMVTKQVEYDDTIWATRAMQVVRKDSRPGSNGKPSYSVISWCQSRQNRLRRQFLRVSKSNPANRTQHPQQVDWGSPRS